MITTAALALVGALLLAPAMASAESAEDTWYVTFEGTSEWTSTGPEGQSETSQGESYESLVCTVTSCILSGGQNEGDIELSASRPTGSVSWPSSGDVCGEGDAWQGAGVKTATFSGSTLVVERSAEASGWIDCGGGTTHYTYALVSTSTAEWTQGELCTLTGDPCPVAEAAAPEAGPADEPPGAAGPGGEAAPGSQLRSGDPGAPSMLSGLATPATAGTAPMQLALAVLLTVVLVLLVAFPTALLNSAVESGSERLSGWWARRRAPHRDTTASEPRAAAWSRSWWWAASGVVIASVITAFADPQFGLNPGSGRVVLSILVSFAVDVVLGWALVVWIMSRVNPGSTHVYSFRPLTLLVVVAAVLFTRLTGFEPGIVFGLVAGVAFGAIAGRYAEAKSALVTLGYAFVLALLAWVVYGVVAGTSGESFLATLLVETLAAVAVGGMAALPIALIPLRGMPGHAIWLWNRWVWAGCYAVGLIAFFIVLMPMPFSWDEVGWELGAWIAVYLVYALTAVTAWLLVTRPWRRDADNPDADAATTTEAAAPAADRQEEEVAT